MKKLLLLSLLVLFGCSKDSDSEEEVAVSQTLIEALDGKLLGDSRPKIAIEKSQTHPITHIGIWDNNNSTAECFRNFYYDNSFNLEDVVINSFEILTDDVNTFISELKYTNYCESCTSNEGLPAENTVTIELSISETGRSYIFKKNQITEWPGSADTSQYNNFTLFYNLFEDYPQSINEICEFKRWN